MRRMISPRRVMATLVLVTAALLVGGGAFYRAQKQAAQQEAEADLLTIAALKVDQIVAWRAERLGDAAVLMEDPFSCETAARWLEAPGSEQAALLLTHFRSLRDHDHYQDIQLVDASGRVRLSLSGRPIPIHAQVLQGLAEAWRERRPVLVDLHEGTPGLAPDEEVIAPFYSAEGTASVPAGAFVLQINARQFLYPLIQSWPRPSVSAETLLVRRDGDSVLFLNELRHQANTALALRIPLSQSDLPAVMAVRGQRGIVEGVDYRGVPVLAALRAVPDSPWFMVAKVDRGEALAVWRSRSLLILFLLLGLAAATFAVGGVVWQGSQKEHFQALFEAEAALRAIEARHHTTLMSVGEGVIVTNERGSVELMNPVAERLTGWPETDAVGRPLAEIFALVDERTRRPVHDPLEGILQRESAVDLNDRRLLITRDGREVAIAESFAPLRDDRGDITGAVLVFRDQTEDRLARRLTETRLALIEYAAGHTLAELLTRAVDEVAAFAKSPIGFYHFVEPDQKSLFLQQWSTRTIREFCSAEARGLHYDIDQAGVWTDCVGERKPVIHNDYESLPHRRGLPEGHARVIRELVAPVMRDDKVVAILGVGNKPVDYTQEDVEVVAYLADVTWQIVEQKRAEETIKKMAYHDSLTGLPNRLLLNDRLNMAMPRARRGHETLALLVLDLDGFKEINDTRGHDVGDELLRLAAQRLRSLVRESDTVARIGGDEFCLLLPGLASAADAVKAAEKIVGGFESVFALDGAEFHVTTSVGIALYPEDGDSIETLMRNADRAMYQAKRAGRSNYQRYSDATKNDPLAPTPSVS